MITKRSQFHLLGLVAALLFLFPAVRGQDAAVQEESGSGFDVVSGIIKVLGGGLDSANSEVQRQIKILTEHADGWEKILKELIRTGSKAKDSAANITRFLRDKAKQLGGKAKFLDGLGKLLMVQSVWKIGSSVADCRSALEKGDHDAFVTAFNNGAKEVCSLVIGLGIPIATSAAVAAIPGIGPVAAIVVGTALNVVASVAVDAVLNNCQEEFTYWANEAWNAFTRNKDKGNQPDPGSGSGGSRQDGGKTGGRPPSLKKLNIGI